MSQTNLGNNKQAQALCQVEGILRGPDSGFVLKRVQNLSEDTARN